MENIIKMIADKAGISEAQSQTAVNALVSFLKDKMPAGLGGQVESFIKGGGAPGGDMLDGLKDKLGGILGN